VYTFSVRILRTATALGLIAALVPLLGLPLCSSSVCPMSEAERAACKAMGRECCGTKGQVSHAPAVPMPVLAGGQAIPSFAVPATTETGAFADLSLAIALPAILQDVGLFTLFAVFLI
jgi:hypothetical protein